MARVAGHQSVIVALRELQSVCLWPTQSESSVCPGLWALGTGHSEVPLASGSLGDTVRLAWLRRGGHLGGAG